MSKRHSDGTAAEADGPSSSKREAPLPLSNKGPAMRFSLGPKPPRAPPSKPSPSPSPPPGKLSVKLAKKGDEEPKLKSKPAAVFGQESESDEEEMPAEARMRMKNMGSATKVSAGGPNSFGKKPGFGFKDPRQQNEQVLKQIADDLDKRHGAKR